MSKILTLLEKKNGVFGQMTESHKEHTCWASECFYTLQQGRMQTVGAMGCLSKKLLQLAVLGLGRWWVIWGPSEGLEVYLDWTLWECGDISMIEYVNNSYLRGGQERLPLSLVKKQPPNPSREGAVLRFVIWIMFLACLCGEVIMGGSLS